ncbi:hypothetical protein ACWPKO_17930 [Coraliomargarita sp. W4R53]
MIKLNFLNVCNSFARVCLFGALAAVVNASEHGASHLVYHENFAPYRSLDKHIRIAQAFESWDLERDAAGRYLSLEINPEKGFNRALLVWDLAPIRFQQLSILVKALEPVDYELELSLALKDVNGRSFVVELNPSGESFDGWMCYTASLREDTKQIYDQGKEVSPFVHGRGEVKTSFEGFDFDNVGFEAIFMHVDKVKGKQLTIGFRDLKLFAEE